MELARLEENFRCEKISKSNISMFLLNGFPITISGRKSCLQHQRVEHELDLWLSILDIQEAKALHHNKQENNTVKT